MNEDIERLIWEKDMIKRQLDKAITKTDKRLKALKAERKVIRADIKELKELK